jgi:cell pole-organizing protein PopZ
MAQSNAVQDQPSMEDILTSIRRIIDDSNPKAPTTSVPSSEEVANDDTVAASVPRAEVLDNGTNGEAKSPPVDEIPELDSFLEALDAKYTAQQQSGDDADSSIALIDDAMSAGNAPERDNSKYEARFSEDDRNAFAAVGDVLTANTTERKNLESGHSAEQLKTVRDAKALVSEPARARVGGSLNSLSEALAQETQRQLPAMTEALLKPMLADWLDNNLPSMVERLVREEIERIARGD